MGTRNILGIHVIILGGNSDLSIQDNLSADSTSVTFMYPDLQYVMLLIIRL